MANHKEIIRDQYIRIKMSKEEKELWKEYSKKLGISPSRLARNIIMLEAEKNSIAKGIELVGMTALKKYYKITKQNNILERMKED